MSSNLYLRQAVGLAVGSAGAAAASLAYVPAALAADTAAAASTAPSTELEEVVVTGTRIRRVDAETASPVSCWAPCLLEPRLPARFLLVHGYIDRGALLKQ